MLDRVSASGDPVLALLAALLAQSSGRMDHYLIYPDRDPVGVVTWTDEVTRGPLRVVEPQAAWRRAVRLTKERGM